MILTKYKKQTGMLIKMVIGLWLFVAIMSLIDISIDIQYHAGWSHILMESTVFLACAACAIILICGFYKISNSKLNYFENTLFQSKSNAEFWQNEYLQLIKGLSEKIKHQFISWNLTNAEADIGFLLIKGFSLKEIAELRLTSERTVREQARSIYQKAEVAGRSELTAYFLEDLLLPEDYNPSN